MVWQRSGTVSVQNGSTTVVGANVDFAAGSRNGDSFIGPDGLTYEVANVASATVISILPAYKGATVSGAGYAIMPVQGYDKMLSDAFNNLNNQFGPKLAALGTTGNYDILPVAKGGTGNQVGAATKLATARKINGIDFDATADITIDVGFKKTNILGAVSQTAGVPTGAIIERGSNANGEYTKFADGTMICTGISAVQTTSSAIGTSGLYFSPVNQSAAFAVPFVGAPPRISFAVTEVAVAFSWVSSDSGASLTSCSARLISVSPTANARVSHIAIGRWF